jgi:hypothetical protein
MALVMDLLVRYASIACTSVSGTVTGGIVAVQVNDDFESFRHPEEKKQLVATTRLNTICFINH